uniref:Pulmonary surfactant-associated protein D-like n=1 Tax=Phallusia mammillata TaxID=59560 RepID=A0A6F9DRD9_9ASCI|nr:pulmonary surfactant-associated protein D-like [Phallusia mammillata]
MYEVLYKYIQKAWQMYVDLPTLEFVEVWLASSYTNGNAVSSTVGSVYTRWYSGNYPNNNPGITWFVGQPTRSASNTGMQTTNESDTQPLPFCRL